MKILLIGEFSRLHNSLKEGLIKNGHQVTIVGSGDSFKKYPVDRNIDPEFVKNNYILNKLRHLIFFITKLDIASIELFWKFNRYKRDFVNHDYVQLINETPFNTQPFIERKLLQFIFRNNKNVFLLACGDDYTFISYLLSNKFTHSTLTPYLLDPSLKKEYQFTLQYVSKMHKKTHDYVFNHIKGVIPASVEYAIAYTNSRKLLPMIPNPINVEKIKHIPLRMHSKIKIFHGINSANYLKKGNKYFEEALEIIKKKYADKVEILSTEDLSYNTYISHLKGSHIIMDQVFAHDQGYNALEAMAMGKVVFTGAGEFFGEHYRITKQVAINTNPDSKEIAKNLEILILNPEKITEIGKNARDFVENEHNYLNIAKQYVETWKTSS